MHYKKNISMMHVIYDFKRRLPVVNSEVFALVLLADFQADAGGSISGADAKPSVADESFPLSLLNVLENFRL